MTTPTEIVNLAEIHRGLQVYCQQGAVHELRALGTGSDSRVITFGYYDDLDRMVEDAASLSGEAKLVWFSLNPVNPALLERSPNGLRQFARSNGDSLTSDADIQRRCWLPIDCDPVRPKDVPATNPEEQAARRQAMVVRDWLGDIGWPQAIMVASGNGCQLAYSIDLPNDEQSHLLVSRCLDAVAHLFRSPAVTIDTAVHNASRMWKVPGTLSRKGNQTPDRPHRLARILEMPDWSR